MAFPPGQLNDPTGYCGIVSDVISGSPGIYLVKTEIPSDSFEVLVDGDMYTLALDPASGFSSCFVASSVDVSGHGGTSAQLLRPERFVF